MALHLRSLRFDPPEPAPVAGFPFSLPFVQARTRLAFTTPVTFLVGENGSGKSTCLEALACAAGSIIAGSADARADQTLAHLRPLAEHVRLEWGRRTRQGFFLRAEDFFGYVKRLAQLRADLQADLRDTEAEFRGRSEYARGLATGPLRGQLADLESRYAGDLDARSHGESFLAFFKARCVPGGLYLLDEPEAPLSPLRQIGLIALLQAMTARDAQFIIATHSPLLMALPGATLFNFDETPPAPVAYEALEHVRLTRDFLNAPHLFLKHL
ncbi:MAG: AAA family ATPase [Anaerolineales bacterium]|nr:AAA family ATPase [Anaerolineales bacterium]